jgi:hypothetical protein
MLERLIKDSGGVWSQFGPAIGTTILAIGVIFWINNKAFLNAWVWRVVHASLAFGQLLGVLFAVYLAGIGVYTAAGLVLSFSVLLIPAYFALYRYSYRSAELWHGN